CCRIVSYLPDLLHSPLLVENLRLIQATARIKGADETRLRFCKEFLDERLDDLQRSKAVITVTWKVPFAFGDDAPLLGGVPAGYAVPSAYVEQEGLVPDELAVVYFLLLLFSSAFRRAEPNPSEWRLTQHSMLQLKVERHWRQASEQCHSHLIELYRQVSGGRSLTEDMSLDTDE